MKKYIALIITILLLSIIIPSITLKTQAVGMDVFSRPDSYIEQGDDADNSKLKDFGNIIVFVVRTVGISISVLMLTIIGIKYIIGSVEEKAEYKQTMWPYVVGAILISAGSSLVSVIYNMFQQ